MSIFDDNIRNGFPKKITILNTRSEPIQTSCCLYNSLGKTKEKVYSYFSPVSLINPNGKNKGKIFICSYVLNNFDDCNMATYYCAFLDFSEIKVLQRFLIRKEIHSYAKISGKIYRKSCMLKVADKNTFVVTEIKEDKSFAISNIYCPLDDGYNELKKAVYDTLYTRIKMEYQER